MKRRCRMCTFNAKNVIALDWSENMTPIYIYIYIYIYIVKTSYMICTIWYRNNLVYLRLSVKSR